MADALDFRHQLVALVDVLVVYELPGLAADDTLHRNLVLRGPASPHVRAVTTVLSIVPTPAMTVLFRPVPGPARASRVNHASEPIAVERDGDLVAGIAVVIRRTDFDHRALEHPLFVLVASERLSSVGCRRSQRGDSSRQ